MIKFLKSSKASTAVEFAIILPVLLLVLLSILEFGITMFFNSSLDTGIRDVSRQGVPQGYTDMGTINAIMNNNLGGLYNTNNATFVVQTFNSFSDMTAEATQLKSNGADSFFNGLSTKLPPQACPVGGSTPAPNTCQSGQIILYGVRYKWGGVTGLFPFVPPYLYSFSVVRDESFQD